MVHIKKLEIYGFKSFGFKNTVIHFEKGLVAITGPNGSGKSNVLDAIMFAIGENSPKALRVDKFQSLFHDSQNRSHRLIRVSLTFDNTDREIPMDYDSVTVTREMEGQTGDSQYHLNGKKVSKANLIELLEVIVAAPNKLNIVQQGMITRISELNSEERRRIIEDIVGLSYFDEKKAEALKQLEESDRRLEVAVARMSEVRKRIDELEVERNDQLRYGQLESELKRFKAVSLSNSIRELRNKLASQNQLLYSNTLGSSELFKQIEEIRSQIEKLESEKTSFINQVNVQNKAKTQIGSKIMNLVYESERTKAMLRESQLRHVEIEKQLPTINIDKESLNKKLDSLSLEIEEKKGVMSDRSRDISVLQSQLKEVNSKIDIFTSENAIHDDIKEKFENRYKRVSEIKKDLEISVMRLEEKIKTNSDKIKENEARIFTLRSEIKNNIMILASLRNALESGRTKLSTSNKLFQHLIGTKISLERVLVNSSNLLERAKDLATKYEAKKDVAKNSRNEDLAIAELMKDPEKFGIKGLAYNVLKWDKSYERALLAAGSEWMKAFIVDTIISMISIAEYAKLMKLPRLKIIPLDGINSTRRSEISLDDVSIIGNLADFVYSDYKDLPDFLFGDTFLVRSSTTAYTLARQGYRAVSIDGVLFEPAGSSTSLDFASKISDFTKAILFSDSIDNLRCSLTLLEVSIKKRRSELNDHTLKINNLESQKTKLEARIENLTLQISTMSGTINKAEESLERLMLYDTSVQSELDSSVLHLDKYQKRMSIVMPTLRKIRQKLQSIDNTAILRSQMAQLNMKKNQILKSLEEKDMEIRQIVTSSFALKNEIEILSERSKGMDDQRQRLKAELEQTINRANEFQFKLESIESELRLLRDEEQQAIDSSGSSYSVLQEYERKIKELRENERKILRDFNTIEKDTAVLRRDIDEITSQESHFTHDLFSLGHKDLTESFDTDMIVKELTDELQTIKNKINLRAHENYIQVIEGYRSMSSRQNQLEMERNSIIVFIEEVVKEKKSFFTDAFKRVDSDIRKTFSEVTDGQAWLELENVQDIFSAGVMLMVQFPGKTERESTGLSGGEKTMAATIFLLALQSLKPSPFYLMDEVDAHLDAQNNERLSKALLSRSTDNQIIMVTLKDTTIAKAHLIYGIYPKEGVSQIVKYRHPNHEGAEIKSNVKTE